MIWLAWFSFSENVLHIAIFILLLSTVYSLIILVLLAKVVRSVTLIAVYMYYSKT